MSAIHYIAASPILPNFAFSVGINPNTPMVEGLLQLYTEQSL